MGARVSSISVCSYSQSRIGVSSHLSVPSATWDLLSQSATHIGPVAPRAVQCEWGNQDPMETVQLELLDP